jgi:hypothetical protein
MTNYDIEKNEKCKNILRTNGFEYNSVIGCNEVWINYKNKNK